MSLTQKQEAFALAVFEGKSQADAYRLAYSTENMSDNAIYSEASKLMDNPKVSQRLAQLREKQAERTNVTADDIVRVAWELAQSARNEGARVSALNLLAKRHPEFSDKHELKHSGAVDLSHLTDEQIERLANG